MAKKPAAKKADKKTAGKVAANESKLPASKSVTRASKRRSPKSKAGSGELQVSPTATLAFHVSEAEIDRLKAQVTQYAGPELTAFQELRQVFVREQCRKAKATTGKTAKRSQRALEAQRMFDQGSSIDEIAKTFQRSKSTVYRWLQSPPTR